MKIKGLQKLTLIDYPSHLACTVFLSGCNYRCPWCYSSELVLPEKIADLQEVPEKEFFDFLKNRKFQLDGVVLCGGEPTLNPDLPRLCKKIKALGFKIKLDTNGSNPKMLGDLMGNKLIDYTAMDIKAPKEKYAKLIGFEQDAISFLLTQIEKSISLLKQGKIDYEFRTTFVPGLLEKQDILKIASWLKPAKAYFLQNFRPEKTLDNSFESIKPYPENDLLKIQKAIAPFFEKCEVR